MRNGRTASSETSSIGRTAASVAAAQKENRRALASSCAAIFWPGAFIFGFPGVMGAYWQQRFGVDRGDVGQVLFFVLAGVGCFMYLTGRWQERLGPSRLTAVGAALCGGSMVLVGWAADMGVVYLWAFTVGASSAFIYIPALTVAQRRYPKKRGLVSGLVNMVFGLSAAVMSPVFSFLLLRFGYAPMTLILGAAALSAGLLASRSVSLPQAGPSPERSAKAPALPLDLSLTVAESLRTRAFWFLWLTWAFAGAAGIAMVTLSSSFGLSKGLTLEKAVFLLTAFNLTNGFGRLVSGHLSDVVGRNNAMTGAFAAAGAAYLLLPRVEGLVGWALLSAVVGFAFGALFAVSAPLAFDCFGMKHFGAVFGMVFTAYGFVAGPVGPWLCGHLLDATAGDFRLVFTFLGTLFLASAVSIWFVRPPRPA